MDVFSAIADPVRRDLLVRLARGPARVVDLTAEHEISRPAISRHLRVLSEAQLVEAEEIGRERHYRLRVAALQPVADLVADLTSTTGRRFRFDPSAFDGLDLEVRRTTRERQTSGPNNHAGSPTPRPTTSEETA